MATPSAASARRFLDALDASGRPYAILHGEDVLLTGDGLSDLDLAIGAPSALDGLVRPLPGEILAEALQASGLRPALRWWYDLGATATFAVDRDAGTGVQIDLLADPRGTGKYGLRTDLALAARRRGSRYQVLDPVDERLYLIQKRALKGMGQELDALLRNGDVPVPALLARAPVVLAPAVADRVVALLEGRGDHAPRRTAAQRVLELERRARRFVRPVGAWVHIGTRSGDGASGAEAMAVTVAERFGRLLPHAIVVAVGAPAQVHRQPAWYARHVRAPLTRPAVVVTHGLTPSRPKPLVVVEDREGSLDRIESQVIDAMNARCSSAPG